MALITGYDLKNYMRNETVAVDDSAYALAAGAACEYVSVYCQRDFSIAGAVATARTFAVAPGDFELHVDDFTTVTSVVDGSGTVSGTGYQLRPLNGQLVDGTPVPYDRFRRLSAYWYGDTVTGLVTVTATWGWVAVPSSVKSAALILGKDIVKQRDVNSGVAGFGDFGAVRVRLNPLALSMLARFRRVEAFGIA